MGEKTLSEQLFGGWKHPVDERDQIRMARLVRAVRKAMVMQITFYSLGEQKSISEYPTIPTFQASQNAFLNLEVDGLQQQWAPLRKS